MQAWSSLEPRAQDQSVARLNILSILYIPILSSVISRAVLVKQIYDFVTCKPIFCK